MIAHIYPSVLQAVPGGLRGVPGQGDSKGIGAGICKILHLNFREFLFRDCPKRGTNNALSANLDVLGGKNGSKSAVLVLCKATGQAPLTLFGQSLCSGQDSLPIHSGLLLCLVGKAIGDPRRTRVDPTIEDEAAARAGAAARATCDVGTLHGTYLGANDGTVTGGADKGPFAAAEFQWFDGNGNTEVLPSPTELRGHHLYS